VCGWWKSSTWTLLRTEMNVCNTGNISVWNKFNSRRDGVLFFISLVLFFTCVFVPCKAEFLLLFFMCWYIFLYLDIKCLILYYCLPGVCLAPSFGHRNDRRAFQGPLSRTFISCRCLIFFSQVSILSK